MKIKQMLSNTLRLNFCRTFASLTISSKNSRRYSKKLAKEHVCLYSRDYVSNHNENEDENEK